MKCAGAGEAHDAEVQLSKLGDADADARADDRAFLRHVVSHTLLADWLHWQVRFRVGASLEALGRYIDAAGVFNPVCLTQPRKLAQTHQIIQIMTAINRDLTAITVDLTKVVLVDLNRCPLSGQNESDRSQNCNRLQL